MNQIFAMLAAAAVFVVAVAAEAAELRDMVTIDRDVVVLGDLVEGLTEDRAAIAVAQAPQPGRVADVPGTWVARVARAYGVTLSDTPSGQIVRVARASNQVDFGGIQALLIRALRPHLAQGEIIVEMPGIERELHLPTDVAPLIALVDVTYEPTTDQFTATVVAPAEAAPADQVRIPITGFARAMVQVPVLARDLDTDTIVVAGDLDWVEMDAGAVPTGALRTADGLVGMAVRRLVPAGDLVMASDLVPPVVIPRGGTVMIAYTNGALTIMVRGRALEDGALGQLIRISNADSGRTLDARVTGPNMVEANASTFAIN